MSHIKYKEGEEHPANPKIRNYCKYNEFPMWGLETILYGPYFSQDK